LAAVFSALSLVLLAILYILLSQSRIHKRGPLSAPPPPPSAPPNPPFPHTPKKNTRYYCKSFRTKLRNIHTISIKHSF
jgi:hypothetical protein